MDREALKPLCFMNAALFAMLVQNGVIHQNDVDNFLQALTGPEHSEEEQFVFTHVQELYNALMTMPRPVEWPPKP